MSKTKKFLNAINEFAKAEYPDCVIDRCRESLLDYIGVTYAGICEMGDREEALLDEMEADGGTTLAIGLGSSYSLKDAVFLNGLNAHALDYDDGVNAGIIHLGSPVFSVLLPLAKMYKVDGLRLLRSAIVGYEVAWSLAISIQPGHKLRGYHATGTCGMLGAVVAACHMLQMSEKKTFQAFSIACLSASGMLCVLDDGSQLKPYNVAKAAMMAVTSIQMARAGFEGPDDALGGDRGFLALMAESKDIEIAAPLLDGKYAIMRTYTKPYGACRYCHPSIEAAIEVGRQLGNDCGAISCINVSTYSLAVKGHDHSDIKGIGSAKMSIPFGVASGIVYGKAGLSEYTESAIGCSEVLDLANKVSVRADEALSELFPEKTVALLEVALVNGERIEVRVESPKGEPENPLGWDGVCDKFREMVTFGGMSGAFAEEVISSVSNIECDLSRLLGLLERRSR